MDVENKDIDKKAIEAEMTIEAMVAFQKSPFAFIEAALDEVPQPIKPEFRAHVLKLYSVPAHEFSDFAKTITKGMFMPFVKGVHLTWQQTIFMIAVQRAVNGSLPPRIAVKAGRGVGKGLCYNEVMYKIINDTIHKVTVADIKVGDKILGKDRVTQVTAVMPQPVMKIYKVTLDDGSSLEVNEPHLFTVSDQQIRKKLDKRVGADKKSEEGKWETIDVAEMLKRGVRCWEQNPERRFRLPIQKVEGFIEVKDAYVIGVWYGDGSKGTSAYTKPDQFVADKISSLGYTVGDVKKYNEHKGTRTIYGLLTRLKSLGVPTKTKEGLPANFLSWDFNSRVELLRGLMDTDGYCDVRGISEFSSSVPKLAEDVQMLIRSLGGKTRIRVKEKTFYKDKEGERVYCKPSYRLTVSTTFNPFSLPRKQDRYKVPSQDRYLYRFIDSIEYIKDEESVCFSVDAEDRLFLAGDGLVVTHNSNSMSKLILWYLFSYPMSRVPCTAPTSDQLFAVLWSEINLTLAKMKPEFAAMFEWTSDFIRIKQHPQTWYARAKTAGKGQTGALSGIHSDYMASFADESYDIEEEVFQVAEATQTGEKSLMVLVGNAVHDHGYFYDCFNKNSSSWINITMNGEDSPIVNPDMIEDQKKMYGEDSNHYRASIKGEFPIATAVDIDGWRRMFSDEWIDSVVPVDSESLAPDYFDDKKFQLERSFIGVDPAGEGTDEAVGYIRNALAAKLLFASDKIGVKGCASNINGGITLYELSPDDVSCDNFGVGAELSQEVAILSNGNNYINGVNVGNQCEEVLDKAAYFNERARIYDMLYWWGKRGGKIQYDELLRAELKTIFSKDDKGKLQIMPKKEMRKRGYKSPGRCDSISLSFVRDYMMSNHIPRAGFKAAYIDKKTAQKATPEKFNKHDAIPSF